MKCVIFSPNFQPSNSKEGDGSTQPALSVGRISVISSRRVKGSPLLARSPLPTFPRGWLPCSASKFCRGKRSHTRLACPPSSRPSHMLMYSLPPCRSFAKAHSLQSSSTRLCPAMRAESGAHVLVVSFFGRSLPPIRCSLSYEGTRESWMETHTRLLAIAS